jgi:hypothetical protein
VTLTVRSATVSGATTKGSALTHAELDENFNHLSQASNHSFTQSGTGAVSDTVQNDLRNKPVNVLHFIPVALHAAIKAGTDTTDLTSYIQAAVDAAAGRTLYFPKGIYYISTAGGVGIASAVRIVGDGIFNTSIYRNFSPSGDSVGALNIEELADGSSIEDMGIYGVSGTSGGTLVSILATASETPSGCSLKNLWLSTTGSDTQKYSLYIDGSLKTGSPIGIRDMTLLNVTAFGGATGSAFIKSVQQFGWFGGGIFQAGGTAGTLFVTGTAGVPSNYVSVNMPTMSAGLNLDRLQYASFVTGDMGNITNTANVSNVVVVAGNAGTIQSNWTNSSYFRADRGLFVKGVTSIQVDAGATNTALQIGGNGAGDTFAGFLKSSSVTQVSWVGTNQSTFAAGNGTTFTFTFAGTSCYFEIADGGGRAGAFHCDNTTGTVSIISDPSSFFENSATPTAGKFGVFKSAGSSVVSVINSVGSSRNLKVQASHPITATTDPA